MTAFALDAATTSLSEIDRRIVESRWGALSLDPARSTATPLTELVSSLVDAERLPQLSAAAVTVAEAQLESFPENLFWDFDFYLASIHSDAKRAPSYVGYLESVTSITAGLLRLYGKHSEICFRYVHDFMYGYDWARWVRRDPGARAALAPFGLEFLRQTESRGRDILELIDTDDDWYPKLAKGVVRNPFPFSREPEQELRLYRLMAERAWVPVEAWRVDAQPSADRDFDALREEAASSLGLSR